MTASKRERERERERERRIKNISVQERQRKKKIMLERKFGCVYYQICRFLTFLNITKMSLNNVT